MLTSVVDGFPNLTTVGWGIYVYYNPNLVKFSGFDALPETGDNIDFWYNDSLARVLGFQFTSNRGVVVGIRWKSEPGQHSRV